MQILDLIEQKKAGRAHAPAAIEGLVRDFQSGRVPDYQMAAWLMAVTLRGLDTAETAALTRACWQSGEAFAWPDAPGPVVDKHSTGGVGDKTSLVVVPLAAACGLVVPKISGRGLGMTGGTLDKLEAIPGLRVDLSETEFVRQVNQVGAAIASQSQRFVPADGAIYALRDVTGTVDSIPLIAASVMSKKLAAGASTIVLDVKVGRGAFMKTYDEASQLAEAMVRIGEAEGRKVRAILTSMDRPLGRAVGHAIEVAEALETLRGEGPADLTELALTLTAALIRDSGLRPAPRAARERAEKALRTGAAEAKFREMVAAQAGDLGRFEEEFRRSASPLRRALLAPGNGYIETLDAGAVSRALRALGGARSRKGDAIDRSVGILLAREPGEEVRTGEEVAWVLARSEAEAARALEMLAAGLVISASSPELGPLILGQVTAGRGV